MAISSGSLTENGMGVEGEGKFRKDGVIQDDYRIDFVKDHLRELHRAIQDGANCKGYLIWTFIDCWSWLNGYKNRYGLVELELESQNEPSKNLVIGSVSWVSGMDLKSRKSNLSTKMLIGFSLTLP